MSNKFSVILGLYIMAIKVSALEHLSKKIDLKVNSKHDTLFAFSNGVLASNRQPADVVELLAVNSSEGTIENYLQLHPFGKSESVSCSIKLENTELYQLNLTLDKDVKMTLEPYTPCNCLS